MEISEYQNIYRNEEKHFFYNSTHYLVEKLIKKYSVARPSILDAGCGTGGLLRRISKWSRACGIDFSDEAVRLARNRNLNVKKGSVLKIPFSASHFDVVTSIDVIYHTAVTSDIAALKEFRRVLKPGGILILRVPANKFLFSAHDRHVHTARRYSKEEIIQKIKTSGLKVRQISYVHAPIFPLSVMKVAWEKIASPRAESTIGKTPRWINMIATKLLCIEADLITDGLTLPFGQGLIAVATK